MIAERLAGLEPAAVFAYFEKLCSIRVYQDLMKVSDNPRNMC